MSAQNIIANYESLSQLTAKMRQAAENSEWQELVELENDCSHHVAQMKQSDDNSQLNADDRQRKVQLIKKILADDAQIRDKTETWMIQLKRIMQTNRQEQRLQQSYGRV